MDKAKEISIRNRAKDGFELWLDDFMRTIEDNLTEYANEMGIEESNGEDILDGYLADSHETLGDDLADIMLNAMADVRVIVQKITLA